MTIEKEELPPNLEGSVLSRIEARLEHVESMLSRLEGITNQMPGMFAMATDVADEWATCDGRVDARLTEVVSLLSRATRPEVLSNLQTLVTQLEAAPGMFAMFGDMIDEFAQDAQRNGADLHGATAHLFESLQAIIKLLGQPEFRDLIESGVLSPGAVRSMNMAARALASASAEPSQRLGFFSALSKARNPDVQRALSFMLATAENLGRDLAPVEAGANTPPQLKASSQN